MAPSALHSRSSKTNQGRRKERKGCPCSNPGTCLRVMFPYLGSYQLSQSTVVSCAFLLHPSSSCKYKRRERAMLNIRHSPRVPSLLVIFMDAIDLLWLLVPARLDIRVANPHIKECRALGIPEATRPNVQSCLLCFTGPSTKLFFSDVLENWLDVDIATHSTLKIGLEVSQLAMTLDYKAFTFTIHCVVYCEVFSTCTYRWNVIERPIIT